VIEMHVLLDDDRGRLTLKRLWPWHQMLARGLAARLDRELAEGASPEASASLAARAAELTSTRFRNDLAASLRRILLAASARAVAAPAPARSVAVPASRLSLGVARSPRVPLSTTRIGQSASLLAELASRLLEPGPVPVRGVAMVTQLLADGAGPLYRQAADADLDALVASAAAALTW
jgi:hypothetical protein